MAKLETYFKKQGYKVIPHARFNISWGSIISDLDMVLLKDNTLTLVEIKSSHDKLSRAGDQIRKVMDYVDFIYVATDYYPRKWNFPGIGLMIVNESVDVIKKAIKIERIPRTESIFSLKKICLSRLVGYTRDSQTKNISKFELVSKVEKVTPQGQMKNELKQIVTCGLHCNTSCPIWAWQVH